MPLARWRVYEGGPQIWLAPTADDSDGWIASVRHIAIEAGAFVVSVPQFIPAAAFPDDFPLPLPEGVERPRAGRRLHRVAGRRRSSPARCTTPRGSSSPTATCASRCAPSATSTSSATTAGASSWRRRRLPRPDPWTAPTTTGGRGSRRRSSPCCARRRPSARGPARCSTRTARRPVHVHRLRRRALPERHEVRLRLRLAELLRLRRAVRGDAAARHQPGRRPHRGALRDAATPTSATCSPTGSARRPATGTA